MSGSERYTFGDFRRQCIAAGMDADEFDVRQMVQEFSGGVALPDDWIIEDPRLVEALQRGVEVIRSFTRIAIEARKAG